MKQITNANEANRRINRRIAAASVKHMSNTKWRKLFTAIHSVPRLGEVAIKFINDDRLFTGSIPGPDFDHKDNTGECGGISFQPFAHIEFVQIPNLYHTSLDGPRYPNTEIQNDIDSFVERLENTGSFPIRHYDNGITIIGYEWAANDGTIQNA
ncbi:MAG: hypothetical protein COA78_15780 [Blastopirellula sp.]|nr:MAG: hypothetical protein COA78_15780 [Blastopirellula sp.]